jgi:4-hydroxybenzoate polyprenyltransferase
VRWRWRELPHLVRGATRWDQWAGTKVFLLLVAFYYQALLAEPAAGSGQALEPMALLQRFTTLLVFICLGYAFGYAVNDFADRRIDRLAGKPNLMGRLHPATASALLVGLGVAGVGSLWQFYGQPWVLQLVLVSYAVGMAYSLPPMRFKERGWLGPVVGAAAQRSLPALVIFAIFGNLGWEAALFACLLLLIGLRWMLAHQVLDLRADATAGVRTWVARTGREQALRLLRRLVFPLEAACLLAVLTAMVWRLPEFGLLLLPYVGWLGLRAYRRDDGGPAFSFAGYHRQPLADFYEVYWPLSLSLLLALRDPRLVLLLAVFVLWQRRYLARGVAAVLRLLLAGR